jgi:hypothetical protein
MILGMATAATTSVMATTIISSRSENPRFGDGFIASFPARLIWNYKQKYHPGLNKLCNCYENTG